MHLLLNQTNQSLRSWPPTHERSKCHIAVFFTVSPRLLFVLVSWLTSWMTVECRSNRGRNDGAWRDIRDFTNLVTFKFIKPWELNLPLAYRFYSMLFCKSVGWWTCLTNISSLSSCRLCQPCAGPDSPQRKPSLERQSTSRRQSGILPSELPVNSCPRNPMPSWQPIAWWPWSWCR